MAKVFIEESTLTNIGDAIRNKTGKSDLLSPASMATEISSITTGGGDVEEIVLTGDCQYACSNPAWNQFFPAVRTEDISVGSYMFYNNNTLEEVPFEINFKTGVTNGIECRNMFSSAQKLKTLPKMNNLYLRSSYCMFSGCNYLREMSLSSFSNLTISTYKYGEHGGIFQNCYSLRVFDMEFLKMIYKTATEVSAYSSPYYGTFYYCYALDEVKGLYPMEGTTMTSNHFTNIVTYCGRLKDFTFELDENGQPYVRTWSNQTIDFTKYVGYVMGLTNAYGYNSGITADKKVTDAATYEALKNDADWFSALPEYSRYNHDSAVNTINSLPDCSSGSGNVIKFKGTNGSATDGGAINTLTEEEIAVATAKGWTVTLS